MGIICESCEFNLVDRFFCDSVFFFVKGVDIFFIGLLCGFIEFMFVKDLVLRLVYRKRLSNVSSVVFRVIRVKRVSYGSFFGGGSFGVGIGKRGGME